MRGGLCARRCRSCSSSAASSSSACAWNSSPRWRGWRNFSRTPQQREKVLGYTQAFSSLGGILVALANLAAAKWALSLPAIHGGHEAWRYTLISGVIPALPLILIRPFLPESPGVAEEARRRHAQAPEHRASCSAPRSHARPSSPRWSSPPATASPSAPSSSSRRSSAPQARRHARRSADTRKSSPRPKPPSARPWRTPRPPASRSSRPRRSARSAATPATKPWRKSPARRKSAASSGRVLFAVLATVIVSRRALLRIFQIPALLFVPFFFWWISGNLGSDTLGLIKAGIFVAGLLTVAQFSFLGKLHPARLPAAPARHGRKLRRQHRRARHRHRRRVVHDHAFRIQSAERGEDRRDRRHRRRHLRADRRASSPNCCPEPKPGHDE